MESIPINYGDDKMITIPVIFGLIGYFEWRYLKQNNRKQRTIWIVMGVTCFLMFCMEAIYLFSDRWMIATIIETIFYPMQKAIFFER